MKEPLFRGACTAIITPFTAEGVDEHRLKALLDFQAEHGVAAVVLAGTTGENATLEPEEYARLVEQSIAHVAGRMKMIVGIGGNNTAQCLKKARFAEKVGADGLLMSTPYYNKTTQQGLVEHFSFVADRVDLPMILYNVPGRTAIGITADTYRILSSHPNINGVKEASGDFSLIARVVAECGGALNVWSGNDDQTVPMMALGAQGVVSVASNVLPGTVAELCRLCLARDYPAATALYASYAEFFRLLFIETNPIPVKAAMELCGLDSGLLRLPLIPISAAHLAQLRQCMESCGIIC